MNSQNIDSLIEIAKKQESNAHGRNKKCFYINDFVLLKQRFRTEEIEKIMRITEELKEKGVNVARTLEYKVESQSMRKWGTGKDVLVSEGYVLQERAKGNPLLDSTNWNDENKRYQLDYLRQIDSISKEGQEFFNDFVKGWIEIQNSGIRIDPSKTGNFIYEQGKGITFIDLGLNDIETDMPTQIYEQLAVILNLNAYNKCYPEIQEAVQKRIDTIVEKYRDAVLTYGIDRSVVDEIIENKRPRKDKDYEANEESLDEEISRLEIVIDKYIKEENIAKEEERKQQAEREEKARIEEERKSKEERRLEEEDEQRNGVRRLDSKMYALLNGLIKSGVIPEDKVETLNQVFTSKINMYKDINFELFRKQGRMVDLNSVVSDLENRNIRIDMKNMDINSYDDISTQDYEKISKGVNDYFRQYFENVSDNIESKMSEYSRMREMYESGSLTEEQSIDFKLLEAELVEFSKSQELFSYFGIDDNNVIEQSKRISEFLHKQNEISEEDKERAENRRREIDREYLEAAFRNTGITDPNELRKLYEEQDKIRVSDEDLEIVLQSFSNSKEITLSQIKELTEQEKIGKRDIDDTKQEIEKDIQTDKENQKDIDE